MFNWSPCIGRRSNSSVLSIQDASLVSNNWFPHPLLHSSPSFFSPPLFFISLLFSTTSSLSHSHSIILFHQNCPYSPFHFIFIIPTLQPTRFFLFFLRILLLFLSLPFLNFLFPSSIFLPPSSLHISTFPHLSPKSSSFMFVFVCGVTCVCLCLYLSVGLLLSVCLRSVRLCVRVSFCLNNPSV